MVAPYDHLPGAAVGDSQRPPQRDGAPAALHHNDLFLPNWPAKKKPIIKHELLMFFVEWPFEVRIRHGISDVDKAYFLPCGGRAAGGGLPGLLLLHPTADVFPGHKSDLQLLQSAKQGNREEEEAWRQTSSATSTIATGRRCGLTTR